MNCERNDPGECAPAGRGKGKNAILLVCILALLTCTFLLILSNTNPPANATAAAIEYGITRGDGRAFAGPADRYELLAIYSEGITLTVSGRTEDSAWIRVDLSPYRWGWMPAENLTLLNGADALSIAPTPEHLATVTPVSLPAIQVSASIGLTVRNSFFPSKPIINYQVTTREAHIKIVVEILDPAGNQIYRRSAATDGAGLFEGVLFKATMRQGTYTVRVIDSEGNAAEAKVVLQGGQEAQPTPKK